MDFLVNFTEAAASVPDPIVVAGYVLAAIFILNFWWAYGVGAGWGMGLWLLGLVLDQRDGWTAESLSAQMLGSLSGNLVGMWVVLTIAGAVRAVRARRSEQRASRNGRP